MGKHARQRKDTNTKYEKSSPSHDSYAVNDKQKANWTILFTLGFRIALLFSYAILSGGLARLFPKQSNKGGSKSKDDKNDPYEILGVEKGTPLDVIKKAYRKLALLYHPDRLAGHTEQEKIDAEEKMKTLNWAYETTQKEMENPNASNSDDIFKDDNISKPPPNPAKNDSKHSSSNSKEFYNKRKSKHSTSDHKRNEAYEEDTPSPQQRHSKSQESSTSAYKSKRQEEEEFEKQFKEFQKRHTKEMKIFKDECIKLKIPESDTLEFLNSSINEHVQNNHTEKDTSHDSTNTTTPNNKKKHIKKKHSAPTHSPSTNANTTNNTPDKSSNTPSPPSPSPPLSSSNIPQMPPSIFTTNTNEIAIAIRLDLEIIFLELTDPENSSNKKNTSKYILTEKLDADGNTILHYCAYFNRYAIGERVIAMLEENWWRGVLTANNAGILPAQMGLDAKNERLKWETRENGASSSSSGTSKHDTGYDFVERLLTLTESAVLQHDKYQEEYNRKLNLTNIIPCIIIFLSVYFGNWWCYYIGGIWNLSHFEGIFFGFTLALSPPEILESYIIYEVLLLESIGIRIFLNIILKNILITLIISSFSSVVLYIIYTNGGLMNVLLIFISIHLLIQKIIIYIMKKTEHWIRFCIQYIFTRLNTMKFTIINTKIQNKILSYVDSSDGKKISFMCVFWTIFGISQRLVGYFIFKRTI